VGLRVRPLRIVRIFVVCCFVLALAAGIFAIAAWRPALDPINPPAATSFAPDLVKRGAELAGIGNCAFCHTAPAGRVFAGGRAIATPFGTIYSTNITPDAETGIGNWSQAAFQRALRNGVARDGSYLYPAFPYDHFTLVSDDDDKALYAFLMTRRPVSAPAQGNDLPFPLNVRLVLYGWNLLFLRPGPYRADPAHDEAWNRGAYFADGLGHCGSCHTPRNFLGAEQRDHFAGGTVEGWTAYALNAASPAPVPWTAEALTQYLGRGFAEQHGVPRGPMADVAGDLRSVPADDIRAIAIFLAAQMGSHGPEQAQTAQQVVTQSARGTAVVGNEADSQADTFHVAATDGEGALIYAGACAGCHQGPRAMPYGGIDLALSSAINAPTADNFINVVLNGLPAAEAAHAPIMPGFANAMNDGQLAALARYARAHFTDRAPWNDIENSVIAIRSAARALRHQPADHP